MSPALEDHAARMWDVRQCRCRRNVALSTFHAQCQGYSGAVSVDVCCAVQRYQIIGQVHVCKQPSCQIMTTADWHLAREA